MPTIQVDPTLAMYYEDHYFGDPWLKPETVVLVHGCAETSQAWYKWVPRLSPHLRVIRPDLRGFGRSTIPAEGYQFSAAGFSEDLARFLDLLELPSVHLVGAKVGGTIAMQFAATYPDRVKTLSVLSPKVMVSSPSPNTGHIRSLGVRGWAEITQRNRLGSTASAELSAFWTDMMSEADANVCIGVTTAAASIELRPILGQITAPTLVFTTEESPMQPVEGMREWLRLIPNAELLALPGDHFHLAAVVPDDCARHTLSFIDRQREPVSA